MYTIDGNSDDYDSIMIEELVKKSIFPSLGGRGLRGGGI
jgi:hypothetical protein